MAGKGAPPLFDLIRSTDPAPPGARSSPALREPRPAESAPAPENRHAPRATPAPEPKPELKKPKREPREPKVKRKPEPRPDRKPFWARKPERAPERDPEPSPAATTLDESENDATPRIDAPAPSPATGPWIDFKKKFSVPISVLYIVVPLILLGALLAYSTGFSAGGRNRDNELKPYLQPGDIVDPLLVGQEGEVGRGAGSGRDGQSAAPATTPRPATPAGATRGSDSRQASTPAHQRPAGSPVTRDTRQPGHNYLLLARLDGERAIKAAMALTERGLPTIAVESGSGRSNNAWRLYSLLGISSEKFKEEWQLRADHKARLEAACRDLGPDAGGPIDASTAYWEKYAP